MSLKAIIMMISVLIWTITAAPLDLQAPSDLIAAAPTFTEIDSDKQVRSNVAAFAGIEPINMWVPPDGDWSKSSNLGCYDINTRKTSHCNKFVFDKIAVAKNYTCTFRGANKGDPWENHQHGTEHSGWMIIKPAQKLAEVKCVEGDYDDGN